jgi:hypothetical protein
MLVVLLRALKDGAGFDGTILQAVMQTEIDALTGNEQTQTTN